MEWEFSKSVHNLILEYKVFDLLRCIWRNTLKISLLAEDAKLFKALENKEIGLQITNRFKAPILLYLMCEKQEALDLAAGYLSSLKPTPKDRMKEEPDLFGSWEEAWSFFKRDKDPRTFYNYQLFYNRFIKFLK